LTPGAVHAGGRSIKVTWLTITDLGKMLQPKPEQPLLRRTAFSRPATGLGQNLPLTFSNAAAELASTPDTKARSC